MNYEVFGSFEGIGSEFLLSFPTIDEATAYIAEIWPTREFDFKARLTSIYVVNGSTGEVVLA